MPKSLPSTKFAIVDVPEVTDLKVDFVYNFFTPDESVNESGLVPQKFIKDKTAVDFKQNFIDSSNFNRFVPRYNKITWQPTHLGSGNQAQTKISIKANLDKIYSEETFSAKQFCSVQFQDVNLGDRYKFFIRRLAESFEEDDKVLSTIELAKLVNDSTSTNISSDVITKGLESFGESSGQYFFDQKTGRNIVSPNSFEETSQTGFKAQINNKLLEKAIASTGVSPLSIHSSPFKKTLQAAKNITNKAIAESPSTFMDGKDYDFELRDFVDVEGIDTNGFVPQSNVIGYIINKIETTSEGIVITHDPIVVESPFPNSTVDLKIKYGSTYEYSIQSVVLIKVQAQDYTQNQIVAVSFLVSSKPSFQKKVICEEVVPPPAPADFNVEWDYKKNMPRISWNFPTNTQRDIKYFQVFKRDNIQSPFQLIKMYDFDDSVQSLELRETPDPRLIDKLSSPKNYYHDYKYTIDRLGNAPTVIYAVCAIDAHGFSSPYSVQFEVKFDRFKNKLIKKLISSSGAPKAYPNMQILTDTFVDSIRDSKHKSLKIVFTPEYLNVRDSKDNDLELIKSGTGTSYRFQMINVDLQEQQVVDIELKDLRTTK